MSGPILIKNYPMLQGFSRSALVCLGVLAAVGILAQCGWAAAAISRGAPMSITSWLLFSCDVLGLILTLIATVLAAFRNLSALRAAFVLACICSVSPLWHAFHVALHGHFDDWRMGFHEQFQDTAYRLGLTVLPALFSLAFAYMLNRRFVTLSTRNSNNSAPFEVTPWQR